MKICLIGACGHLKQALRMLAERNDVVIVGAAKESDHETAWNFLGISCKLYEDWRRMLQETNPDLAIVSPVFAHTGRVIIECAKRGIDVFSEKPVASSLEELGAVEAAIKESGIRFCAMHYLRYTPAFYHGAQLVKDGTIGEVRMITAQKSYKYGTRPAWYGDRSLYGGTIPWVGIHAIDWIYHFTGKRFLSVNAQSVGNDPELAAICQFKMEDGILAAMNIDYYRPHGATTHGDDRIRCVGTKGILEIREDRIHLITDDTDTTLLPSDAPNLFSDFLDGSTPISPDEIFYLTKIALLAKESADTDREIKIKEKVK